MGECHIPEVTTLAKEMAEAALWQIPAPNYFAGLQIFTDIQTGDDRVRSVELTIRIGTMTSFIAICRVQKELNKWEPGDCTITLSSMPGVSWSLKCRRVDNQMRATKAQSDASADSTLADHVRPDDQLRLHYGT